MKMKDMLFQYDRNQKVTGIDGIYVDFNVGNKSLRVEVAADGSAIIPDEVLLTAGMHYGYVCLADETKKEFRFNVCGRPVPPDNTYAPSHVITFESLVQSVRDEIASLEQRAASGEFDGKDGKDYVITEKDYDEIASRVEAGTTDVQINGESITSDKVANIPYAGTTAAGVVKTSMTGNITVNASTGIISANEASTTDIKNRNRNKLITADSVDDVVKTGLTSPKRAWTEAEKGSARYVIDAPSMDYVDTEVSKKQNKLTAGTGIVIEGNTISSTATGDVTKAYVDQQDNEIKADVEKKQDKLTAGANITIEGNVISATGGGTGDVTKAYVDEQNRIQDEETSRIKADLSKLEPFVGSALPTPTADNYKRFAVVTENGSDRLFINLKKNGSFGWWEFLQGDSPLPPIEDNSAILGQAILGTLVLGMA